MYLLAAETGSSSSDAIESLMHSLLDMFDKVGSFLLGGSYEAWENVKDFFGFVDVLSEIPNLLIEYMWSPLGLSIGLVCSIAVSKLILEVVT